MRVGLCLYWLPCILVTLIVGCEAKVRENLTVSCLSVADKAFYKKSCGFDVKLMKYPAVDEFLYWVSVNIDPRQSDAGRDPWSEDGLVWFALQMYFSENRPMSEAIGYLDEYIR